MNRKSFTGDHSVVWFDRKRFCGMPLSFTRYILVEKPDVYFRLFKSIGLLSTHVNEVDLFRILDISVHTSLIDKIFGVGTIRIFCKDASGSEIYLVKVKNPYRVREILVEHVTNERKKKGIRFTEFAH